MADVKVCDRCGKRLTEERMEFNLKPVTVRYKLSAVLFKKRSLCWYDDEKVETQHDLCVECAGKLSDWMQSCSEEKTANG